MVRSAYRVIASATTFIVASASTIWRAAWARARLSARATSVTAAVSNQPGIMENAAVRLLGLTTQQIQTQAQDIIIGQMRAVIATMRIEDINRDRQAFMSKVNEAVAVELEKIGLSLINVNIRDLDDESGYIKAIGRKAAAEAVNQAIAEWRAMPAMQSTNYRSTPPLGEAI